MTGYAAVDAVDVTTIVSGFARIDEVLTTDVGEDFWDLVTEVAARDVPGAEWASITVSDRDGPLPFRTVAPTDERALCADLVQYELGSGPCVDAIADRTIYCPADIEHDERWPEFGRRVAAEFGVRSMLAFRLSHDGGGLLGALNLYSTRAGSFDRTSVLMGEVVATRAAAVADALASRRELEQIRSALASNREIGVAMGVLMQRYRVSRDQAFDLLRMASQNQNRKLRDIATEIGDTGELTLDRPSGGTPAR